MNLLETIEMFYKKAQGVDVPAKTFEQLEAEKEAKKQPPSALMGEVFPKKKQEPSVNVGPITQVNKTAPKPTPKPVAPVAVPKPVPSAGMSHQDIKGTGIGKSTIDNDKSSEIPVPQANKIGFTNALNTILKLSQQYKISNEALTRVKSIATETATKGAPSTSYNKIYNEDFKSSDDFLSFLNSSFKEEVSKYAPQMMDELNFVIKLVQSTEPVEQKRVETPSATPEQITDWKISQVNKLKAKISDPKFNGYSEPEAKSFVALLTTLLNRFKSVKSGSVEGNKIKSLMDIISGISEDIFPETEVAAFTALKNNIETAFAQSPSADDLLNNIKPRTMENSMDKLKLGPDNSSPITARINFLKKLVKL